MNENNDDKRRQLERIHRLATRLPWIVLTISLIAFVIIFLEVLFTRSPP